MSRRPTLTPLLCALAAAFALTACGGGGDGSPAIDPATRISGTAAAGAPIIGTVTVRDAKGAQKTETIAADGTYAVDVSGMTAPFQFRAVGKVGGRDVALSSVALAADVGQTINITPFSDLIVANVAGRAVDGFLSNEEFASLTTAELDAARQTLTTRLLPILQEFGVADSFDLLRSSFTANRTNFDAVMDVVRVSVDPATNKAIIRDLINDQQIEDDLASKEDTTVITAPPQGSLSGAVTDLQQVDTVLADMTALFANQVPAEDNAQLRALLHPDFLENGLTLDEFLTPDNMPEKGSKLHSAKIVDRPADDLLLVAWEYVGPDETEAVEWYFRKDSGTGKWRILGNQRVAGVEIASINHRYVANPETIAYSRHLELWVESARLDIQAARLTGPGLAAAVTLRRSTNEPDANFDVQGLSHDSGGSWIPECGETLAATCVDFSKVGSDAAYSVQFVDASDQPVGAAVALTLQRTPVPNIEASSNSSKWFATYTVSPSAASLADGVDIVYNWTAPSDSTYKIESLGFSSDSNWFSQDVDAGQTSAPVGTWQGAAPTAAPNTWIHVVGPYDRRFVSGQPMQ